MMLAMAIHVLLSVAQDPVSDQELERLIEDLGARDKASRERAVAALQKIGEPSFPRLLKAATDLDAERALLARQILLSFRKPGPEGWNKDPLPVTSVVYQDWVRGVSFKMAPDGTIELTVPEEQGSDGKRAFKTYRADSLAGDSVSASTALTAFCTTVAASSLPTIDVNAFTSPLRNGSSVSGLARPLR